MDMVATDLKDVLKIVHRQSPLNQEESPVTRMYDLYLNYFRVPMTARSKKYSIMLPLYIDKETVADNRMFIRNHNFH